jgi:Restriction endonuclease
MNRVFVLDHNYQPLMPCHPARARQLLTKGQAAVYRHAPFTIILKARVGGDVQPIEVKTDPGSKTTGIALVGKFKRGNTVLWAANLKHRGQAIKNALEARRSLRRGRRNRKTRYREARFDNRTRPTGWLPPSLQSRVDNVAHWLKKLIFRAPITECHVETVRFDTHALINPEVSGVGYQQGTLFGYELREYLLEKWGRKCAYCGKEGVPLEVEHIHPRRNGGSDRVSNLTLACHPCNEKKGSGDVREFLAKKPDVLKRILVHAKAPMKDAAAVNATRYAIGKAIRSLGLPTSFWSGGRTKFNRVKQGYKKDHWLDAACVGESGAKVFVSPNLRSLQITATSRGKRQVVRTDSSGFPCAKPGRSKRVFGFQMGDLVRLDQPGGKYTGVHRGRLAGIRATGYLDIAAPVGKITAIFRKFTLLQRGGSYAYAHRAPPGD